jgi:hypothetical protein
VVDAHVALKSFPGVYADGERTVRTSAVELGRPDYQPVGSGYGNVTAPVEHFPHDAGDDDNCEREWRGR